MVDDGQLWLASVISENESDPVVTDGDAVGGGKTIKSKPLAWLDHDRAIGETTTIPTPHSDALRLGFAGAESE